MKNDQFQPPELPKDDPLGGEGTEAAKLAKTLVDERERKRELQEQERLRELHQFNELTPKEPREDDGRDWYCPEHITKYYRVEGECYYFKDNRPAFEATEKKLTTKENGGRVIKHMVDIAESKGWTEIKLKGTEDFRREAWLEARLRGLEVNGYKPKETDLAVLKMHMENRDKRSNSMEERLGAPDAADRSGWSENPNKRAQKTASDIGTLLDHGSAPFEFNDKKSRSYFVKIQQPDGNEKFIWGIDIPRAITESGVKVGDEIEIQRKGKVPVVAKEAVYDKDGALVEYKEVETHRNAWEIEKVGEKERRKEVIVAVADKVLEKANATPEVREKANHLIERTLQERIDEGKSIPQLRVYDKDAPAPTRQIPKSNEKTKDREKE
jgi:putative DNA primase/helicase